MSKTGTWPTLPEALPAPIVDNHTHLDWTAQDTSEFTDQPRSVDQQLADAAAVGVTHVVQIGCDIESARWTVAAIDQYPAMLGGVALHPNEAPRHAAGEHQTGLNYADAFAEIAELARHPRVRVIGETGLDYFRTGEDGRAAQLQSFRDHIALAKELGLPMQIHDRDAHRDVLDVLKADGAPDVTVFHCFSGDAEMARECADAGYFLSFAGTVTFGSAGALREAAAVTPRSKILVETDAPFLTPHPHRGMLNSPAMSALTVRKLAEVLDADLVELCSQVFENSLTVYGPW